MTSGPSAYTRGMRDADGAARLFYRPAELEATLRAVLFS